MRFLSVCSGIEAASVAWRPLGWEAVAFAEIEPFPCAVLAHHYPDVPNWGDMTKFQEWPDATVDLLCGGTPCQSFSVAGLRKGLDDPRGNLMLTFGAIAARYRPRWLVWENVPGVLSSNGGRDFGSFLGLLGVLGYGFAYRVLDAQFAGVPQRRRRVFVVGYLGDWRRAAAVLLERHSLSGHPAPSRKAGQGFAASVAPCLDASFGLQGASGQDARHGHGHLIPESAQSLRAQAQASHRADSETYIPVAMCLNAKGGGGRLDAESETLIPTTGGGFDVAHALTGEGFDASEDGTGRGTPLVPIAFSAKDYGGDAMDDVSPTLRAGGHADSHANAGVMPAVAFNWQGGGTQTNLGYQPDSGITGSLSVGQTPAVAGMQVRRLTPRECERLQGVEDDYTLIPHRGKPVADGPRYKALGNSWAIPCVRWIGQRIEAVNALPQLLESA